MRSMVLGALLAAALTIPSEAPAADLLFSLNTGSGVLTFVLDESPQGDPGVVTDDYFGFWNLNAELNDNPIVLELIQFWAGAPARGGFDARIGLTTFFSANGPQLYEGTPYDPTFLRGTFNTSGGELTISPAVAAVPEPGTWAIMLVGFGAAGAALRRRRRLTTGVVKPLSLTRHAGLAFLAMLCLSAPAHAKAVFEGGGDIGGGGPSGILKVEVPPPAPPAPGIPPPPLIFDTTTFKWTGSPGLFFFLDAAGGNTVTSTPEGGSGVVTIVRQDAGLFEFGGIDYAYSTLDEFLGDEPLRVQGFLHGNVIGTAFFIQPVSNAGFFSSFGPGALAGIQINELRFGLDTARDVDVDGFPRRGRFSTSIRNVVFAETGVLSSPLTPIPEPATWALMIGGFGMVGYALRRRAAAIA